MSQDLVRGVEKDSRGNFSRAPQQQAVWLAGHQGPAGSPADPRGGPSKAKPGQTPAHSSSMVPSPPGRKM